MQSRYDLLRRVLLPRSRLGLLFLAQTPISISAVALDQVSSSESGTAVSCKIEEEMNNNILIINTKCNYLKIPKEMSCGEGAAFHCPHSPVSAAPKAKRKAGEFIEGNREKIF
jgi:hypothetical protein